MKVVTDAGSGWNLAAMQEIEFRRDGASFSALAGVNLNRSSGHYALVIGGETVEVTVTSRSYPSSSRCDAKPNEDWPPRGLLEDDGQEDGGDDR